MKYHRLIYMLLKFPVVIDLQNTYHIEYWRDMLCFELTIRMRDYVGQQSYTVALIVYNLCVTKISYL
jgi:hypothetical protein